MEYFDELLELTGIPEVKDIGKSKQQVDKNQKEESLMEMRVAAEYIKLSEKYRAGITLEADKDKILELALMCITEMTGDFVFFQQNMKKLGLG